jgi:arylsulfatase
MAYPATVLALLATAASYPAPPDLSATGVSSAVLKRVAIDVSGEPYVDLEREAEAMLARE